MFYKYKPYAEPVSFVLDTLVGRKILIKNAVAGDVGPVGPVELFECTPAGIVIDGVVIEDTGNGMLDDRGIVQDEMAVHKTFMKLYKFFAKYDPRCIKPKKNRQRVLWRIIE